MRQVFADTSFWVGTLDETDQWFEVAIEASRKIGNAELVTSESVLIETLNYFSNYNSRTKEYVANYVEAILSDDQTLVLLHRHEDFLKALELYKSRLDKGYSLTDCISMNAMRDFSITDVLTNDEHFSQEGFSRLF